MYPPQPNTTGICDGNTARMQNFTISTSMKCCFSQTTVNKQRPQCNIGIFKSYGLGGCNDKQLHFLILTRRNVSLAIDTSYRWCIFLYKFQTKAQDIHFWFRQAGRKTLNAVANFKEDSQLLRLCWGGEGRGRLSAAVYWTRVFNSTIIRRSRGIYVSGAKWSHSRK